MSTVRSRPEPPHLHCSYYLLSDPSSPDDILLSDVASESPPWNLEIRKLRVDVHIMDIDRLAPQLYVLVSPPSSSGLGLGCTPFCVSAVPVGSPHSLHAPFCVSRNVWTSFYVAGQHTFSQWFQSIGGTSWSLCRCTSSSSIWYSWLLDNSTTSIWSTP